MSLAVVLVILGRILLGGFYLAAGVLNALNFSQRITIPTSTGQTLPPALVGLGFAVQIIAGLMVLLGLWPALGAAALIAFTVLATAFYHNVTAFTGEARTPHVQAAMANTGLIGGLLVVMGAAL
jgi:putative oxidoreductase